MKTLPHIFNKLTTAQERSNFIQTTKERRPFPHRQLTSTFLVPELGAEPHQLRHKASEMARKESGSEQGKVWVAGLPLGIIAGLMRLVSKKPSNSWGNLLALKKTALPQSLDSWSLFFTIPSSPACFCSSGRSGQMWLIPGPLSSHYRPIGWPVLDFSITGHFCHLRKGSRHVKS